MRKSPPPLTPLSPNYLGTIGLLLIITYFPVNTSAQCSAGKQGNIWHFGDELGLNFNNTPPTLLTNGPPGPGGSVEGTASISDSSGNLLFYATGEKIWNINHEVMPNGSGLSGGESSTQGVIIIPQPGSNTIFYVFTTDEFQNNLRNGLRYSIVNMCNDDGLGNVVLGDKNISLLDTVAEKLTAAKHANGTDYWVVTHKYFSDAFYSFRVTASGIRDTIISHVGSVHPYTGSSLPPAIGQMKISPDGNKLALVYSNISPPVAELFDFDNSTGTVSNAISLPTVAGTSEYGVSFSPDNGKLYISTGGSRQLYQYDLSSGIPATIIASKTLIFTAASESINGMQLGPDGKIYVSRGSRNYIAVINNPNNAGASCNYTDNGISLGTRRAFWDFPNFIDNFCYHNGLATCPSVPCPPFQRTFGSLNNDYGSSVIQSSDGGYIIEGHTNSFGAGGSDAYLIKTDGHGNTMWTQTYGGTGDDLAYGQIQNTADGGYILLSGTKSFGAGLTDLYLLKLNATGTVQWTKTYGGTGNESAEYVVQNSDGGYAIAGAIYYSAGDSDVYLIRTNSIGDTLWTRSYGGGNIDEAFCVRQTIDTGFIITGRTKSYGAGGSDIYLIKTNQNGDTLWTKTYGTADEDYSRTIMQTADSGYILGGYTGLVGSANAFVLKTDSNGNTLWTKTFDIYDNDLIYSLDVVTSGGYIFAGTTWNSGTNDTDAFIIRTDDSGTVLWKETYGGAGTDEAHSIEQTSDNGFIISATTRSFGAGQSDVYLIKTDSFGTSGCNHSNVAISSITTSISESSGAVVKRGGTVNSPTTVTSTTETQMDILCCKLTASVNPGAFLCSGGSTFLSASGGQHYTWSPHAGLNDTTISGPTANPDTTTTYQVIVSGSCCAPDTAYVTVTVIPTPHVDLGNDTILFLGDSLLLNADYPGATYIWQDNSTDSTFLVTGSGAYSVRVLVNGCEDRDTIIVTYSSVSCDQYIFQKTLIGTFNDHANDAKLTSDKGHIITGLASSFGSGGYNGFLLKTDSAGIRQWFKTYGGTNTDRFESVVITSDGGFFCAGTTQSFGAGGEDVYLIKTNSAGTITWSKTFGGTSSDQAFYGIQTSDGGYIVVGKTTSFGTGGSDVFVVKTDASGILQWTKTYGGGSDEEGKYIQSTSDGGYIIGGDVYIFGGALQPDFLALKIDASGNLQWSKAVGGSANDFGEAVQQTSSGGYILTGQTTSFGLGSDDIFIVKLSSGGAFEWSKSFGFGGSSSEIAYDIQKTSDGGFAVAGTTGFPHQAMLMKTDSIGNVIWAKSMGGSSVDRAYSVSPTSDGAYLIAGEYGAGNEDIFYAKVNECNNTCKKCDSFITPTSLNATPTVTMINPAVTTPVPTVVTPSTTTNTFTNTANRLCDNATSLPADYIRINDTVTICQGDSFFAAGAYRTTTGIYKDTSFHAGLCDTIFTTDLTVIPTEIDLGNDTIFCGTPSLLLDATIPGATYLWQNGSTSPTYFVNAVGTYWVEVIVAFCSDTLRDTINVSSLPAPTVNLGNDTILPEGNNLLLDATNPGASYLWQNGSTNPTYTVTTAGTYWVRATLGGCTDSDTINVNYLSCAGKQGNIWHFGDRLGLNFNNTPPTLLSDGPPGAGGSLEGVASISDGLGNLLFYATGEQVWGKDHLPMPNGFGLAGGESSTQGAIIIPQPGSDKLFYIFTTDEFQNNLRNGLRYSIVNMCANEEMGDVDVGNKNVLLLDTVAEKLTAAKHSNGTDYWVVTHKYFSDAFYSFRVTSSGIRDTIISHVGSVHPYTGSSFPPAIGQMKISPNSHKLALVYSNISQAVAELFDFDNSTGIVSNAISLPTIPGTSEYGVSFSADSRKLYISTGGSRQLYQYDLSSGIAATIIASKTLIFTAASEPINGLQLGPNGKIYVARGNRNYIGVINNPNNAGAACNYTDNGISLGSRTAYWDFPGFVDNFCYNNGEVACPTFPCNFQKTFGDTSNDLGLSTIVTSDQGFIVQGITNNFGPDNNIYLIKTDKRGRIQWTKTYGGSGDEGGEGQIQQTADGGYILVSETKSFGAGLTDLYLIKITATGTLQWSKTYGGSGDESAEFVVETSDGGYAIAGAIYYTAGDSDMYLIRTNSTGDTLWTRSYGGNDIDEAFCILQTTGGGFVLAGRTTSYGSGGSDIYLIKTDQNGDTVWTKTYGTSDEDYGRAVIQTSDSGYIVAGYTGPVGAANAFVLKTDSNGNTLWTKTFDIYDNDLIYSLNVAAHGGYIFAGSTWNSGTNDTDIFIIRTDSNGIILWKETYGGTGSDEANSIEETSDGGFIVSGTTKSFGAGQSDVYLIKTDTSGTTLCNHDILAISTITTSISESSGAIVRRGSNVSTPSTVTGTAETEVTILCCKIDAIVNPMAFVCAGGSTPIFASGGNKYTWSPSTGLSDATKASPIASPDTTTTYQVIVSNDCCAPDTAFVTVTVIPMPSVDLGNDTILMDGDSLLLNAAYPGATYIWQDNSTDSTLLVRHTGAYSVRVLVSGCQASDTIIVIFTSGSCEQYTFQKSLSGTFIDQAYDVNQTTDKGYIMTGWASSFGSGGYNGFLLKTDSAGVRQWFKTYGGTGTDRFESVIQTSDGGYFCAGVTQSFGVAGEDVYLIKTNNAGTITWSKSFGGSSSDLAYYGIQTADGGYLTVGKTASYGAGGMDVLLIKTDASGNLQWTKTYGGGTDEEGKYIQPTTDGGYIITGYTKIFGGALQPDFLGLKIDASGNLQWSKAVGSNGDDYGEAVVQTSSGSFVITGLTLGFGLGSEDIYVVKLNAAGDFQWSKSYGFGGSNSEIAYDIQNTGDGGFAIAGTTGFPHDVMLMRIDSSGNVIWTKSAGGNTVDRAYAVTSTSDGAYMIAGESYAANGNGDIFYAKMNVCNNPCKNCDTLITPTALVATPTVTVINPAITTPSPTIRTPATTTATFTNNPTAVCDNATSQPADYIRINDTFTICQGDTIFAAGAYRTTTGIYSDTVTHVGLCDTIFSTDLTVIPTEINLGNDTLLCSGDILLLSASVITATSYLWQDGSTAFSYLVSSAGTYWVEVEEPFCNHTLKDTINVSYLPAPVVSLGNDTVLPSGASLLLDATNPGATYLWQNASTNPTYLVSTTGIYRVTATIGSCVSSDTIVIEYLLDPCLATFQRTYGTSGSEVGKVVQLEDGRFVIMGETNNTGSGDYMVARLDAAFNVIWTKSFGNGSTERVYDIIKAPNGKYLVAGTKSTDFVAMLAEIDPRLGSLNWLTQLGTTEEAMPYLKKSLDNRILNLGSLAGVTGTTQNKIGLIKYDANNSVLWKIYHNHRSGTTPDNTSSENFVRGFVQVPADSGIVGVAMNTLTTGSIITTTTRSTRLFKTDKNGTLLWVKGFQLGATGRKDQVQSLVLAGNTDLVFGGNTDVAVANTFAAFITRVDNAGTHLWTKTYGTGAQDNLLHIIQTSDGGFIATGSTTVSGGYGGLDLLVLKIGSTGNLVWAREYGGTGTDEGRNIVAVQGGYIVSGYTSSFGSGGNDIYLLKIDSNGVLGTSCFKDITTRFTVTSRTPTLFNRIYNNGTFVTPSTATVTVNNINLLKTDACPSYLSVNLGNDTTLCKGNTKLLNAANPGASYLWQNGSTNNSYLVTTNGVYWVEVNLGGCIRRDSIQVDYVPQSLDLGPDTSVCEGSTYVLDATIIGASYIWQDNSTAPTFTVSVSGTYWVHVTDTICTAKDTVTILFDTTFTTSNAGPDQFICNDLFATLDANQPDSGFIGTWSVSTGSGSFIDLHDPYTTVNNLAAGINSLLWEIGNGDCAKLDTIKIIIDTTTIFLWTGEVNDNWHQLGNWDCGYRIPDSTTHVIIPTVPTGIPLYFPEVRADSIAHCKTLLVEQDATLIVKPTGILKVFGRW